ncbi:tyrosine-type recombinase/integrase [Pantoea sp. Bo_2]|uniref:tyrosine-type recombinase/integrase n=1 Tax=unclassified Pantoea TaxID=2630326 RepID=UPI001231FAF5|nr:MULTISPECIES: tyrosine-type recombinase/integrase [unclassified Pantoea]KAA5936451.1 tyrosine-type recombinase/integrase [Pantoea sp. VH_3]KAA5949685.1 tyrosine-type recombinase/integrase [Pantoea sp. VH_25]KAA5955412.1 tyrosine-type recombinase/integrase [Pantoea sp. VH_24]KAA5958967.1 tyrosine-type recombinase/integrase [Pantoea sp. VH_16]KAA5964165.1 tyrosine-type recombinase/integrase [Pantoea sp. VH_18]
MRFSVAQKRKRTAEAILKKLILKNYNPHPLHYLLDLRVKMFLSEWISEYQMLLAERGLSLKTIQNKQVWLDRLNDRFGRLRLHEIETADLHRTIRVVTLRGYSAAAKTAHSVIRDLFSEAYSFGIIKANPAAPLLAPRSSPTRSRLIINEWRSIFNAAHCHDRKFTHQSMLLALITGQRRGDIAALTAENVRNEYLYVTQQKSNARLAIPLSLRLDAIGLTLGDVIRRLPSRGPLLRFENGSAVTPSSLSYGFLRARRIAFPDNAWDGTPPTFHEQRSLAERLYYSQGIDTRTLLGHKSQRMTDHYHDNHGREWIYVRPY